MRAVVSAANVADILPIGRPMPLRFDLPAFQQTGFAVVPDVLSTVETRQLKAALTNIDGGLRRRGSALFGARNLLAVEAVREMAATPRLRGLVRSIAGADAKPVRALLFDKTSSANWPVLWHQDLTVAIAERRELQGWGPWSVKAGIIHAEPPEGSCSRS